MISISNQSSAEERRLYFLTNERKARESGSRGAAVINKPAAQWEVRMHDTLGQDMRVRATEKERPGYTLSQRERVKDRDPWPRNKERLGYRFSQKNKKKARDQ